MQVAVRCYGEVRERVGRKRLHVDLDPGATVADLLDALTDAHPEFVADADLVIRIGDRHVDRDEELADGTSVFLSGSLMPE